ncbi:hypothetical protein Taro_031143 [Colocasia esculenta]|uniref:DUF4216 domain-containing protein n=1 Tax=Colocasia esculenta TaxID=4460 RepID=A0A843VI44_COLES|nr:hypothetical protein [Colocasia esculenta]
MKETPFLSPSGGDSVVVAFPLLVRMRQVDTLRSSSEGDTLAVVLWSRQVLCCFLVLIATGFLSPFGFCAIVQPFCNPEFLAKVFVPVLADGPPGSFGRCVVRALCQLVLSWLRASGVVCLLWLPHLFPVRPMLGTPGLAPFKGCYRYLGPPIPTPVEGVLQAASELKSEAQDNKVKVEGSVAKAYIMEEISNFCSMYFEPEIQFLRTRPPHNDDGEDFVQSDRLSIFKYPGRAYGCSSSRMLNDRELHIVDIYILLNCIEVESYVAQFDSEVIQRCPYLTDMEVEKEREKSLASWLKYRVEKGFINDQRIREISYGPSKVAHTYLSFIVNGYRFHTRQYEQNKSTMNNGVCVKGSTYNENKCDCYGIIEEILELQYLGDGNHIFLFKCHWFNPYSVRNGTTYGIIDIRHKSKLNTYFPFILFEDDVRLLLVGGERVVGGDLLPFLHLHHLQEYLFNIILYVIVVSYCFPYKTYNLYTSTTGSRTHNLCTSTTGIHADHETSHHEGEGSYSETMQAVWINEGYDFLYDMFMEAQLKRPPQFQELFDQTHKKKGTDDYISEKAREESYSR